MSPAYRGARGTFRKVLNRLTAQGVVLHDQVRRTHSYRLNSEHLATNRSGDARMVARAVAPGREDALTVEQRNCGTAVTAGRMSMARLGMHSNTGNHSEALALLKRAERGSVRHLSTLLNLKNKAACTYQNPTAAELKKMVRSAEHLVEVARRAVAARG